MEVKLNGFADSELSHFREVQRLAYACTTAIAAELREGMTEKQAARLMFDWMGDHGVKSFFHKPFAWFGDRTAFVGIWNDLQFFPTRRRLEANMPVILDVAPMIDGFVADIGHSLEFGSCPLQTQMRRDLVAYRQFILDAVNGGKTFAAIYAELDVEIARNGYLNAHRHYPQQVLGHRVARLETGASARMHLLNFGIPQFRWLIPSALKARFLPSSERVSPLWNGNRECRHLPPPGLWAVEPHIGRFGVGAKWEEILVITEDRAFWLDDAVPHMQEAEARGWLAGTAGASLRQAA